MWFLTFKIFHLSAALVALLTGASGLRGTPPEPSASIACSVRTQGLCVPSASGDTRASPEQGGAWQAGTPALPLLAPPPFL